VTEEVTCIDPEIQNFEDKLYNLPEKKEL
jgi:hypothetical protein